MNQSVMAAVPVVLLLLLLVAAPAVVARPNSAAVLDHRRTHAQRVIDAIPVAGNYFSITLAHCIEPLLLVARIACTYTHGLWFSSG